MMVEMHCGQCDGSLIMDISDELETFGLDLVHRWTRAHEQCGFIAPSQTSSDKVEPRNNEDTD